MPAVRPYIDWDIHSTTVILKPEDVDPDLQDEEQNNWFMCCVCQQDLIPGETVCRFPQMDGQVVLHWEMIHPLCVAKLMIDHAAHHIEESVRI